MIRPASFGYNEETATNNVYQQKPDNTDNATIQQQALIEFDAFANKLTEAGVNVIRVSDTPEPPKPDALFPNNWISFHEDGTVVFYPMYAANRRIERRNDIIEVIEQQSSFRLNQIIDLTHYEEQNKFLEGTGSLVLDRVNQIAYASVSEKTAPELVKEFARQLNYKPVIFNAVANGVPVYHTNVVLSVCDRFVVICLDYISSETEKEELLKTFTSTQKEVLTISAIQVSSFARNMLELNSKKGENLLAMSTTAYNSLDKEQLSFLNKYCKIIHSPLNTIEKHGGGSARCMLAEIFLPGN
jgi:hypothetical protein